MPRARSFRKQAVVVAAAAGLAAGAGVGAPADAGAHPTSSRARVQRVVKGARPDTVALYWAEPAGGREVRVISYVDPLAQGAEFDIVDQRGYVGRVRVGKIEAHDLGCAGVKNHIGVGEVKLSRGSWGDPSLTLAITATRLDLSRARILLADQVPAADLPRVPPQHYPDVGLDADGDGKLDFARYYHDCPAPQGTGYGGRASNAYCMDLYRRDRGKAWALHSTVAIPECY